MSNVECFQLQLLLPRPHATPRSSPRSNPHITKRITVESSYVKKGVVLGGSAGGIQALCSILKGFPADFPAPLLAVIHVAEQSNALSSVLQRCSALEVVLPKTAEPGGDSKAQRTTSDPRTDLARQKPDRRHEKANERKCGGCGARYSIVGRSPPKIMKSVMKSAIDGVSTPGKLLSIPLDLKCLEN